MRGLCTMAALLAAPGLAWAQADCSQAPTQLEATECAQRGWADSDAELNRLWAGVKPLADGRGQGEALLAEQRAWLRQRDATCEAERDQFAGGSIMGQIYWSCMDRLTRARNRQLEAWR